MLGERFGRLIVIEDMGMMIKEGTKKKRRFWKCKCDCGNIAIIRADCIKSGNNKSCGCLQYDHAITTHGMTNTKIYAVWASMKSRCKNENDSAYEYYGKRGITYHEEWENFEPFWEWAKQSGYKENLTLERIDVNGNYEPKNCKWITQEEQLLNTRRSVHITYKGKIQTLKEWSDELDINYMTLFGRVRQANWSIERAFTEPLNTK